MNLLRECKRCAAEFPLRPGGKGRQREYCSVWCFNQARNARARARKLAK